MDLRDIMGIVKLDLVVIKFFDCEKYRDDFIRGTLFMRNINEFRDKELGIGRADTSENKATFLSDKGYFLCGNLDVASLNNAVELEKYFNLSIDGKGPMQLVGETFNSSFDIEPIFSKSNYILSCSALAPAMDIVDGIGKLKNPFIEEMKQFGKYPCIFDLCELLNNLSDFSEQVGLELKCDLVKYYDNYNPAYLKGVNDDIVNNAEKLIFNKPILFEEQREVRIVLCGDNRGGHISPKIKPLTSVKIIHFDDLDALTFLSQEKMEGFDIKLK